MKNLSVIQQNAKNARAHVRHAVILIIMILSIISSQILLSVATASGAYEIAELKTIVNEVSRKAQSMKQKNDTLASPQFVAMKAEQLGMVANNTPAFLRLSDGAVLGQATPASPDAKITMGGSVGNSVLERTLEEYPELKDLNGFDITDSNGEQVLLPLAERKPEPQVLTVLPSIQTH